MCPQGKAEGSCCLPRSNGQCSTVRKTWAVEAAPEASPEVPGASAAMAAATREAPPEVAALVTAAAVTTSTAEAGEAAMGEVEAARAAVAVARSVGHAEGVVRPAGTAVLLVPEVAAVVKADVGRVRLEAAAWTVERLVAGKAHPAAAEVGSAAASASLQNCLQGCENTTHKKRPDEKEGEQGHGNGE